MARMAGAVNPLSRQLINIAPVGENCTDGMHLGGSSSRVHSSWNPIDKRWKGGMLTSVKCIVSIATSLVILLGFLPVTCAAPLGATSAGMSCCCSMDMPVAQTVPTDHTCACSIAPCSELPAEPVYTQAEATPVMLGLAACPQTGRVSAAVWHGIDTHFHPVRDDHRPPGILEHIQSVRLLL